MACGTLLSDEPRWAVAASMRETLAPTVDVHEADADVNDAAFATAMADRLHELIQEAR